MPVRVTQRDIARAAKVSYATVSLALRGHHSISDKMKAKIRKIAQKIGYVPDPMLSGLSAYRKSIRPAPYQNNIAWLNTHKNPKDLYIGEYKEYYAGAILRCKELGYVLEEVCLADFNFNLHAVRRSLLAKGISGILLTPSEKADDILNFDFSRFSAVRFGYSYKHPFLHTVTNAQFRTAAIATNMLISLGYKRIGLIVDKDVNRRTAWNFIGGFNAACQEIPLNRRIPAYGKNFLWNNTDISVIDWINKYKVDCILAHGCWMLQLLKDAGVKIPKDIGYADLAVTMNDHSMSGMHQNSILIGQAAITLLDGMMQRKETGIPRTPMHIYIEGEWTDGGSVTNQFQ